VERQLPALRPFRADGGSPGAAWFRIVLLIGIVLLLVISQQTADEAVAFGTLGACLLAVVVLARVTRRLGLNRPVLLDDVLGPGQGVERLQAARACLDLAASSTAAAAASQARLLVGRFRGRAVNAWATRLDRDWAVVVAPELLTRLDDAELRALLAHELGHLTVAGGRRRRIAVVLLAMATALLALGLPDAFGDGYVLWLVTGLDDLPVAYGTALLTAMQLAVGYLAFVLLRPLVLVVHRADEAAADLGMLRMTADPQACARFLARQTEIFGLPYRWTAAQRLLVATHPSIGDRIAAVTAETVGGRS
jgi:Zn-dependent protease with chaperone function